MLSKLRISTILPCEILRLIYASVTYLHYVTVTKVL